MPIRSVADRLNSHRLTAALLALLAAAVVGGFVVFALASKDDPKPAARPPANATAAPPVRSTSVFPLDVGQPKSLSIKAIRIKAPVIEVGTTPAGAQDVPRSIDEAGWWRDGVQPGRRGNAVIVGHTASRADGVFDNLGKLHRGDAITVHSKKGTLTFTVTRLTDVKVADFPKISSRVYRVGGAPGLVLMTCGDFNGKTYDSTTIAFATLSKS